jgi:hypothetical protein
MLAMFNQRIGRAARWRPGETGIRVPGFTGGQRGRRAITGGHEEDSWAAVLNQRSLGFEPIAALDGLQGARAQHRENARLAPSTLAPAVGRWRQFSGRNPVADRPLAPAAQHST